MVLNLLWKLLTLYVEALHRHSGCFCCVNQSPNGRHLLLHLPPDITSDGLWKTKSGTPNLEANDGDQED
uniref:Secreted protein n=1 Tax=Globodera pallida TaxID=36090 RepID=A0A183BXA2_GLOPA